MDDNQLISVSIIAGLICYIFIIFSLSSDITCPEGKSPIYYREGPIKAECK